MEDSVAPSLRRQDAPPSNGRDFSKTSQVPSQHSTFPLDRVRNLAIALDLDPDWLMRICVEEWIGPEIAQALQQSYAEGLTENERVWLEVLRHSRGGNVPPVTPEGAAMILRALEPRFAREQ